MNALPFTRTRHNPPQTTGDLLFSSLARLLAVVGTGMTLATFALWALNGNTFDLGDLLSSVGDLLMALACCVVAGFILGQRPRQRIGWLLLTIGLLWAIEWFGEAYAQYAYVNPGHDLPGAAFLYWLSTQTWVPGFGLVIWLILLFPDGRPLAPRWLWIGVAATLCTVPIQMVHGSLAWPLRGPQLWALFDGTLGPPLSADAARFLALRDHPIGGVLGLAFLLLMPATVALFLRLRRTHGIERQQLKWFAYAVSLFAGTMALATGILFFTEETATTSIILSALWELLYIVTPSLLPIAIGIAILRHRLWDIDLIIRRTLVYSLLTGAVIGVYILLVGGLGTLLATAPVIASPGPSTLQWQALPLQLIAAGAVAVLFQPLRQWLQQRVNRLLYGEVDEPYAVMARLGQQLEATLAPAKY